MRRIMVTGLAVLTLGLVAACSGTASSPSMAARTAQVDAGSAGAPAQASVPSSAAGTGAAAADTVAAPLATEAKIRTAELTVEVTDARKVSATADTAEAIAQRVGGEVDGDERTSGKNATATVQLRVPPAALAPTLTALSRLGTARSRHLSTQDVTEQVADVNSRTASAAQAIARLRELYRTAAKISDVIEIEGELSQRESDLESLQARQRALARETALASITLTLRAAAAHAPAGHQHRGGFLGGLAEGWHAFVTVAATLATAAGAGLPFLVLVLLVGGAVRLAWPRLRPRRSAPSE